MGKVPGSKADKQKHAPLQSQLKEDLSGTLRDGSSKKSSKKHHRSQQGDGQDGDDDVVPAALSGKILKLAREQQDEDREQPVAGTAGEAGPKASTSAFRNEGSDESDNDSLGSEAEDVEEEEYFDDLDIDEADAAALEAFMPSNVASGAGGNLADLVMSKIATHEAKEEVKKNSSDMAPQSDKVVEAYTKVGQLLSRYKSGPLPKAFKILPTIPAWPSILELTEPDKWTPHAVYAATKIFASNLDPKASQRFYRDVLLPQIREEIEENKKLDVHTYMAIKKAMYKPAAFFKGVLFPLCESGNCTLREAAIVGSVITKVSIPVLHSGAALLRLAEMDYTGPNSLFIRVLLDKKYALPYKVVDALVFHFIRFKRDPRDMPVLWHQSLLVFAQRYKADMTPEQKEALMEVLKAKMHPQITPEIRRELVHSTARGEMQEDADMEDAW